MAVLSAPTNIPTLDGTTAVCVSDDATGTVYLSVRTDRAWYSVANGDSQELVDADKAVIIAGTTDANIVFAANQAASLDPEQLIDGLAARLDPANPYYVGWVQQADAGYSGSYLTSVSPLTFARASAQTGPDAGGLMVEQTDGNSVHVSADWSGSAYSNTSGLSEGVLQEDARTTLVRYSEDLSQWAVADGLVATPGATTLRGVSATNLYDPGGVAGRNVIFQMLPEFTAPQTIMMRLLLQGNTTTAPAFGIRNTYDSLWLVPSKIEFDGPGSVSGAGIMDITGLSTTESTLITLTVDHVATGTKALSLYLYPTQYAAAEGSIYATAIQIEPSVEFASSYIRSLVGAATDREATQTSATMATLGLAADTVNDIGGQIVVRPQFNPSEDRGAVTTIFQLYGDGNNHIRLEWAQATDVISLIKTAAGTTYTAEYTDGDLAYSRNDALTIDWSVTASGLSLQVEGFAEKTDANPTALSTALATMYLGQSQSGGYAFQVVETCTIGPV